MTLGELALLCVQRVRQDLPPASDASVAVDYRAARSALRPDSLTVVEVPYTATTTGGQTAGSYVCGVTADATFLFFSDHEPLDPTQWSNYASGARPGNLEGAL